MAMGDNPHRPYKKAGLLLTPGVRDLGWFGLGRKMMVRDRFSVGFVGGTMFFKDALQKAGIF